MREPQQVESASTSDPGEMSGLELLLSFGNDEALRPGVAILLGMHMTDIEHGRVAFVIETRPEFGNPMGGRIATAKGRVTDGDDRLLATATTTCMIFRE